MSENQLIHELLNVAYNEAATSTVLCMKVFKGSENCIYFYGDSKGENPYTYKHNWTSHRFDSDNTFIENFFEFLVKYTENLPAIKVARLQKKANGIRIRFDENYSTQEGLDSLHSLIEKTYVMSKSPTPVKPEPTQAKSEPTQAKPEPTIWVRKPAPCVATEKKGNKMGDFSLSNLKDALVDKITHLDRKTVMILSIIALLLLIAGKYNTIKDILAGIKNKVKNSDNFKAMVTDGTNAINSLKKIVGVKGKGDADAKA